MAGKMLSVEPTIDPSAAVRDSTLGAYCEVGARTILLEVAMGDYSYVVNDAQITYTTIGKFCSIAAMTRINPGNHPMHRATQAHFTYRASAYFPGEADEAEFFEWRRGHHVHIGHDVWIGHGAVVLPGRNVGTGAVIAAGAIVTKDVPAYTIVAGNPARPVKRRFPEEITEPARRARVVGLGSRDAAAGAARFPQARGRGLSRQIRSCRLRTFPQQTTKCDIVTDILIEGGRALLGNEIAETSLRTAGAGYQRRGRGSRPRIADRRCRRPAGAAGHRRSARRRLRASDDAATRGRFPDRRGAGRQRPAGHQQRHHHRLSCHDLVLGAGPAQRRQCQAVAGDDRADAAKARRRHPLPSAPRDLQSRGRGQDHQMDDGGPHRPARVQRSHGLHHRRSRQAAKAQPHGGAHRAVQPGFRRAGRAGGGARARRARLDRASGAGRAAGRCPHAFA